jgi:hypothetical protein
MQTSTEHGYGSRHGAATAAILVVASLAAPPVLAQRDDVPLPPRIDTPDSGPTAAPPPSSASPIMTIEAESLPGRAPRSSRLAPLPEDRGSTPDEIVVIGGGEWRLPDLGSWRAEERAEDRSNRIRVTFLHLYDPEAAQPAENPFLLNGEQKRFGNLQVIRWRFGRKPKD